ncbi:MAG: peptidoglycan DD-metalloendopeptidase family protein [Nanoarchaeota archaeon]|nr:peptidoglycan DD-metalloendopeptidase family protein [Nanoarchaeota archaeon]
MAQESPRDITDEEVKNGGGSDLRTLIEEKTAELQRIHDERARLEASVAETKAAQKGLNKEIGSINYNVKQLDLSIKSNEIVLQKLDLEIEELQRDTRLIERNVGDKKETIGKLMFELYQRDRDDFFVVFLRSGSLSGGVSEIQSLMTLNSDLAVGVEELRDFQQDLIRKAAEVRGKQGDMEAERKNLSYRGQIAQDQKQEKQKLLATTKNQEKIYQEKIAELDRQQEEIGKVIEDIESKLRESFDPTLLPVKRSGVLTYPVEKIVVTQKYGKTKFAEQAYKTKFHNGVDFGASIGTPILASADGKIIAVDNNDRGRSRWEKFQYGKYILIEHENNLTTLYAHLSKQIVSKGDIVKRGDIIGYSGNTGYSTGPHIHLTVLWAPSVQFKTIAPAAGLVPVGITIDPEDYL